MTGLLKQQIAAYDKQVKPLKAQNRELNDKITVLQVVFFFVISDVMIFLYIQPKAEVENPSVILSVTFTGHFVMKSKNLLNITTPV